MLSLVCGSEGTTLEHSTTADNGFGVSACGEFPRHLVKVRISTIAATHPDEPRCPTDQTALSPATDHFGGVAPLLVGLRYRQPVLRSEKRHQEEQGENRLLNACHVSFLCLGGVPPSNTTSPYVLA